MKNVVQKSIFYFIIFAGQGIGIEHGVASK
jgi:hypothetical protein